MMRALVGRGLIIICLFLALIAPVTPVFGYVVAGLLAIAFYCVATSQRSVWEDGWHAAHEHHRVDGHPNEHLTEYQRFLSRQGWID